MSEQTAAGRGWPLAAAATHKSSDFPDFPRTPAASLRPNALL